MADERWDWWSLPMFDWHVEIVNNHLWTVHYLGKVICVFDTDEITTPQ